MIEVDIVTPVRKLVEAEPAEKVVLPGTKGQLEVLPGHTELLTLLETGELSFPDEDGQLRRFAVSYGFAEVRNDKVLVLVETCEESNEIDKERAAKAQKLAEEKLSSTLPADHFRKYELKLQRAVLRQNIAE